MNRHLDTRAAAAVEIEPFDDGRVTMCPNCGSDEFTSNLIDERPFRQAARGAKMLRGLGHFGAAGDVLTRLASVKIINFLRMKWNAPPAGRSSMSKWFDRAFATAGQAVAEARHEILGGWFGRHFEPHPMQQKTPAQDREAVERDIHGNEHGIDR